MYAGFSDSSFGRSQNAGFRKLKLNFTKTNSKKAFGDNLNKFVCYVVM